MSGDGVQGIEVSVGKDLVIMGTDRIEVSPDGKKVTAYANDGVEARAAPGAATTRDGAIFEGTVPLSRPANEGTLPERVCLARTGGAHFDNICLAEREGRHGGISISADFNRVVLNGVTIERAADGHLVISSPGTVISKPVPDSGRGPGPANDGLSVPPVAYAVSPPRVNDASPPLRAKTGPEIGAVESRGEHKGEIYGGIWSREYGGDDKPIWFLAAPGLMNHYKAAAWAATQGGSLPTRNQGNYLTTLKTSGGVFTEIFNRGTSFPAGYVWLAEPFTSVTSVARCQRLSVGDQSTDSRDVELPVLCVRR